MARKPRSQKRAGALVVGVAVFLETAALFVRARRLAGNVVVRCRQGHLFTTIWIPAASVKALRLGWWRLQRCPVGGHWSVVTSVDEADLSEEERRFASEHHDVRVP